MYPLSKVFVCDKRVLLHARSIRQAQWRQQEKAQGLGQSIYRRKTKMRMWVAAHSTTFALLEIWRLAPSIDSHFDRTCPLAKSHVDMTDSSNKKPILHSTQLYTPIAPHQGHTRKPYYDEVELYKLPSSDINHWKCWTPAPKFRSCAQPEQYHVRHTLRIVAYSSKGKLNKNLHIGSSQESMEAQDHFEYAGA